MKWLLVFLILVPLGGMLAVYQWAGPSLGGCTATVLQTLPSPDNRLKAIVFEFDCGATTAYSTQVSVLPSVSKPANEAGNVFIADDNHGAAPSGRGGGPRVWVKWLNSTRLKVVFDRRARAFLMERQQHGVSIVYQAK